MRDLVALYDMRFANRLQRVNPASVALADLHDLAEVEMAIKLRRFDDAIAHTLPKLPLPITVMSSKSSMFSD